MLTANAVQHIFNTYFLASVTILTVLPKVTVEVSSATEDAPMPLVWAKGF
jgi:hypothetical protein